MRIGQVVYTTQLFLKILLNKGEKMEGYYFFAFAIWVALGAIGATMNEKRNRNEIHALQR